MRHLWAPWRMQYILQSATDRKREEKLLSDRKSSGNRPEPCFICDAIHGDESGDRQTLLVHRGENASIILNRFPYNNGHLLVVPHEHLAELTDFSGNLLHEPIELLQLSMKVINLMMEPQGFNIGLNQGRVAGAGLPGHLHWHLVPRWLGDVNFMPTVCDTRVIVDSLHSFYVRFKKELSEYLSNNSS
ncbi:MAG: HIT family protein [bacterium]